MNGALNLLVLLYVTARYSLCSASNVTYPDCNNASTYEIFNLDNTYNGLNYGGIGWNRVDNQSCNVSAVEKNRTNCGDCAFSELKGDVWYRFSPGPNVKIAEYPDNTACPRVGQCNGYNQVVLVPNNTKTGNPNSRYYGYMITFHEPETLNDCGKPSDDPEYMVEQFNCTTFVLYRMFKEWDTLASWLCLVNEDPTEPKPTSLCMNDTVSNLQLQCNRKYYSSEGIELKCSATRAPTPPELEWSSSNATLNLSESGVYKRTEMLSSTDEDLVKCSVIGTTEMHEFLKPRVEVSNATARSDMTHNQECRVHLSRTPPDDELFFITGSNYFTKKNSTMIFKIDLEGTSTYRLTIQMPSRSIPNDTRATTEEWSCGIRDSMTGEFITSSFSVTRTKVCKPGHGFLLDTDTICGLCPNGTYSATANSTCLDCPPKTPVSPSGSSHVTQCVKDKDGDGGYEMWHIVVGVIAAAVVIAILIGIVIKLQRNQCRGMLLFAL